MAAFHQTIVCGNLGRDPETRYLGNGDPVCNFSVAVTEKWRKDGEQKEQTTWYRVNAFGKLAEICEQYLKKGQQVFIQARMKTEKWTDKEGKDRYTTKFIANQMQMLGSKSDSAGSSDDAPRQKPAGGESAKPSGSFDDMDEIPF